MTLPLPLLRLDDLDCWTTDRCRKRRPINAHDAGYAPTFKPNLHLSAKLPPNYHDNPTLAATFREPATDVLRAQPSDGRLGIRDAP